jgi:hypothetical protein
VNLDEVGPRAKRSVWWRTHAGDYVGIVPFAYLISSPISHGWFVAHLVPDTTDASPDLPEHWKLKSLKRYTNYSRAMPECAALVKKLGGGLRVSRDWQLDAAQLQASQSLLRRVLQWVTRLFRNGS